MKTIPKPYSYRYVPGWASYNGLYYIQYNGTDVLVLSKEYEVRSITDSLNGAYAEGWRHSKLEEEQNKTTLNNQPIPKNIEEAINFLTTNENKEFAKGKTEHEFLCSLHHGFGTGLRNDWGLWTGSELSKWFNKKGIYHPDDMTSIILTSIHRVFNNKEINLRCQIKKCRDYWDNMDPKVNKGEI